jgi:hypothetical protein
MKHIALLAVLASALSGCIVRSHHHQPRSRARVASCPPAHHWEGGACVHNGNGRGNGRGKGRR